MPKVNTIIVKELSGLGSGNYRYAQYQRNSIGKCTRVNCSRWFLSKLEPKVKITVAASYIFYLN